MAGRLAGKIAVPAMRDRGGGSIINISSIYGLVGSPGSVAYHASKGAVRLMTKAAALEYAPEGIRVNSVHPGFIATPMLEVLSAEERKAATTITPLGPRGHTRGDRECRPVPGIGRSVVRDRGRDRRRRRLHRRLTPVVAPPARYGPGARIVLGMLGMTGSW